MLGAMLEGDGMQHTWYLNYKFDDTYSLTMYKVPLWFLAVSTFAEYLHFSWLYWVKFPNWRVIRDDGEWYGLRDWYGNLGEFLYIYTGFPLTCWASNREDSLYLLSTEVAVNYETAKKLDPEFVAEMDRYTIYN
jgi:hypothetical protein